MKINHFQIILAISILVANTGNSQNLRGIFPSNCDEKIEYTVQSPSIRIKPPEINYWDSIHIYQNEERMKQKKIYLEDRKYYKLFDSLSNTKYTIRHISSFGDIFEYQLNLESDTLIEYPVAEIKYSSKEVVLGDLKAILDCDTLKLVIQEFGCYHFLEQYYEIINIKTENSQDKFPKQNQILLTQFDFEKNISKMIREAKDINYCDNFHCCDYYSLKANNMVYLFYNYCVSDKLLEKLNRKN